MPNKITYTITTADGKEHQVSKENVDKYGIQSYADAYKGATIRMRDAQKGDYDIPLQHFDNARKQGLHAFSLEHTPIQKQTAPKATPTPTAKPATSPRVHPQQSTPQVSKPLLSDSFSKGADFLKPKPVGYNLSEGHRTEVLGEQAKRSATPSNPHVQRAVQLGNEAKAKRVEREQNRFGKPTIVKAFDDAVHGDKKAAKELGMQQAMQQKKDEIDYMQATGKELRNPVDAGLTYDENGDVVHSMFAPTVARDEHGNIVTNDAGEPLVGVTSDEARAKAYGDSIQTGIEAQREKDKVDNLYKDAVESVDDAFNEEYKKKEAFRKEHPFLGAVSDALEGFSNRGNALQYVPEEAKAGLSTLGILSKAAVAKNNADRYGDAGTLSRLYGGIMAGLTDPSTYDFGITDTFNAANLYRAAKNYEEGKATDKDKMLLDAAAIANNVQLEASDKLGGAFGAGQNLVGTIGFMAQMATNPASGVGKEAAASVAKTVAKRALQKFGKGAIAKAVTGLAKGATRVGMDAVEAGVVTGMYSPTKIVGDYLNRKTGDVQSDGKGGYIFQNKEYSDVKALAKAINGQYAENISEMWGEYLPGVGKVNAAIGRGMRKVGLGKVVDAFEHMSSSNWAKTWKNFQEKTKWNGMAGEYFEEVANNFYNAVTNGDMTLDTDPHTGVFNPKINLDTFYSVALMSGIMSGVNTAGYARERYKAPHEQRKADAQARSVFGERWDEYKDAIDNADEKQIGSVMEKIGNDKSLSNTQKVAALQYQYRTAVVHGVNAQDTKNKLEGQFNAMDEAYSMGYNLQDEKELNNTAILYDEAKKQATKTTGWDEDTLESMIGKDGGASTLAYMKHSDEFNDEQLQAFTDYANARAAYNGMIQRVKDDIDTKVHESNLEVDQRTNLDTGAIHPATMKVDDRQVYIVNGNVVMLPDGSGVDHEHSDDFVVLRDADTGELETADPSAIFKVDAPINPKEEKEAAADNIRQTFAQQQADKIDGKLEFKQGDTYPIIDKEDGTQHSLSIIGDAIDEKTGQVNPEMVLVDIDGAQQPTLLPKAQVQQQVDEARRAAVAATQVVEHAPTNSSNNTYNINDEVTFTDENGNIVRGSITAPENEDGKFEVYTEQPINGKKVNLFSAEELDLLTKAPAEDSEDATIQQPQQQEETEEAVEVVEAKAPQQQTTALERIPKDESGQPLYEQTDPETAWDAIVEQTEGDTSMAQTVADDMVSDLEAGVKKAEKTKTKSGGSIAEKIAAEKERAAVIEQAKETLAHWRKIAAVNRMREAAIQAEEQRKADEMTRVRKEEEEKARAEQEEAERIKRETLNGVPDFIEDKAPDARARGYRRVNGDKVDRQEPIDATIGKEVQVKFDDDNIPTGHVAIIEANQLQPSHKNGQRNPQHFIDEAQPKERKDDASVGAARKIAANIRPEEITSSVTAYTGAPTVNSRGEVIQGNNRSAALREMWNNQQEQGDKYKKYLIDNAETFGLRAEDIAAMDKPILVNMLDVNDDEAISLGQFVASDTESGGTERIKPKNVAKKLGDKMKNFANILLRANDENISFAELVDSNGIDALKWLNTNGVISPTQYKSAFDSKGNITAEAKNDIKGIMYQSIFEGGNTQLEEMFNALPAKAQKAILATAYRDYDSPQSERMIEDIQDSIMAYYALSHDSMFMNAKNHKDARIAVEAWRRQLAFDDVTGESYLPAEKYNNFALLLATMYKGDNQSLIQGTFNRLYDLIQGTQEETLFEQPDNTPRSLVQAIKETLNIEHNGQQRSNVLAGDSSASQEGRAGSNGDATPRGRSENIDGAETNKGGTEGDTGRSGSGQSSGGSQEEVAAENSHLTKKEAADFIAQMELGADVAQEIPLTIENWDKEFGEDGIVSTPIGDVKMGENQFAKLMRAGRNGKLGMLKPTLEYPDAIVEENSKAKEGTHTERPSSFIFIKSFRKSDGTRYYYFTSITVSVDGKEVVVSNQEKSRNRILRLLMEGSVIWRTPKDATTSSAEKQGLDYVHPDKAEGETKGSVITPQNTSSAGKDSKQSDTKQKKSEKSAKKDAVSEDLFAMAERVAAEDKAKRTRKKEEAKVDTNPTEAQKEAGNYKKGHIKVDGFNVTIEQPKGSVRRGKDANGKEWKTEMHNTYGYIRGTESVDGDHIDIFLSDNPTEGNVFVIDQVNKDGSFDEHKVMYGFSDMESARKAYLSNYEEGWQGLGNITEVSKEEFKKWIDSSKRKTKPFAEYSSVKTEGDVNVQHPIDDKGSKRLVSNERYEELKKRMRSKLGQLNLGVDPEMLAIGAEMAVYHIENGARAFGAYAKEMISDLGDAIRPYLKAFYNGARDLPEMVELSNEMTPYEEVSRFDIATIGNEGEQLTPSAIETAEQINNEAIVEFNAKQEQSNTNELEDVDNDAYSITKQHNNKKDVDIWVVRGKERTDKEVYTQRKQVAKEHNGYYSSFRGVNGFVFNTAEEAHAFADAIFNTQSEKNYAQNSEEIMRKDIINNEDSENQDKNSDEDIVSSNKAITAKEEKVSAEKEKPIKKNNSKKKDVSLEQPTTGDLFGGFFNENESKLKENEDNPRTRTENRKGNDEVSQRESSGSRSVNERELDKNTEERRSERQGDSRVQSRTAEVRSSTERPSGRLSRLNVSNNHAERGADYAPTTVDARIEANIKAIELANELVESGEKATPEQMSVLRKFSGWGGLGKAFNQSSYSWSKDSIPARLQSLLGAEAYEQAVMSANSAYYTPAYVIDTLWDIAKQLGFKGGNILEGSAGIGNILGLMPMDISDNSHIQAVEIDGTSGNILSLLYPEANVNIQGFEETRVPNGSVDLAITNVPFVTGLRVNDTTGDGDLSKKFHNIHDFCIAKNVRKLREGGIGIFISSNGTLDRSQKLRDWLVSEGNADVVGAFRLNNKTFGGTGVTSDIIVIRKRVNGQVSPNAIDVSTVTGERSVEFDTGETKRVKGVDIPVVKHLSMDYNKYFIEHPEMMAGKMEFAFEHGDKYRATSKGLYPTNDKSQDKLLSNFVQSFTKMKDEAVSTKQEGQPVNVYEELGSDIKEGSMLVNKDGQLCVAQLGQAVPLNLNTNKVKGHTKEECFNAYTEIKQALADVLKYQTENETDEGLKPLLDKLNKAYDSFVDTYGHLNKNTSIAFLRNDVDYPNVFSLEKYEEKADKNGKRVESFHKTDIFNKRVVEKSVEPQPKNVKDGIVVSVYKFGKIDIPYISHQLGKTEEEIKHEIIANGLGFENPVSKQVEVSYQYLSGNVREKLKQAEENNENGEYNSNIKALKEVVPNSIPAHLIEFNLGSSWIAPELYEEYVKDKTDVDVKFTAAGGTWFMKEPHWTDNEKNRSFGVHSDLLGKHVMGHELIEAAIQNKTITVSTTRKLYNGTTETITDKEATQACSSRIDEIRQEFKDWARNKMQSNPEMSDKMEQVYNDLFNNYVPIDIPSEYIPEHFGGATHNITLRPHQAKAVVRGTMQPLMLAHEVGTGKTFTLISTAMEMRRLGTARKPMIVVQNATVGQFVASAKELYPNAKILTLEDSDRNAEGRKNFYAKIRYNDWDMIVVPQSTFEFIPDSEERQMTFIQDKIEEKLTVLAKMKDADKSGRNLITRQAEKEVEQLKEELANLTNTLSEKRTAKEEKKRAVTKQNTEVKAREMLERRTDETENFDDMGIDALLIDEAHEYKHLGFATAMQRGVNGVDPSYSKKSQGVFLKTQAVLSKSHGRNVIFATGTPISNTAAEIWTFMRYLMPSETMKEYGIYYFDDFVRNFGNIQQMLEFTTSGKFRENNRFAGYIDLPELVRIWSSVSDTVRTKDAGEVSDKIPKMEGDKAQDLYLPQTPALRGIMKYVKAELEAYDKMSGKEKKENSHIPLTMYGIAKAAAVDARLVDEAAEDDPNSKTNEAVRQTLRSLKETASYNGTVALFADNYQNKTSGFNLYEDIRRKLIEAGVPEKQIVVMKSGMTVKKKLEIFDKVNRGEVRVILGSTFTLGTGVNIQERLHTLIHIDAPNRPMDYTQRNGRILRQGNIHKDMNKPVRVLRFGVEDSLDVTAYQRLKTKGAIAESIMKGKQLMANSMENRILEEEEDAFGDTVAQLSGSEYAMLKNQAEKNVRKYESRKRQWEADQTYIHNAKPRLNGLIKNAQLQKEENEKNLSLVNNTYPDGKLKAIIVGKHKYDSVAGMEDFFKDHNKKVKEESEKVKNGTNATYGSTINVDIDGLVFTIHTEVSKEMSSKGVNLFAKSVRTMTYSQKELGLKDVPVKGALMRNAIEDIADNIITGNDFKERVERAKQNIAHYRSDLEHILSREGKPFEFENELEEAKAKYVEYTEAMKKEMEEKEKKYAEMDKHVEAVSSLSEISEDEETLMRSGQGSFSDNELSFINDPVAKMLGKNSRTEEDRKAFAERERQRMISRISELADRLHLNNIEAVTDSNGLQGKKAKAKGFYSKSSGKITIVIPNHASVEDVEKTLLHEAVAHYGLRKLFGEHFETFLDNVYQNVEPEIRRIITSQAANNNWDFRTATEEYLAGLAERTDFERVHYTIWNKIKSLFLKMLHSIGFEGWSATELSDNELRYLLWRSYENMKEPDRYRSILGEAEDIAKQNELKVGNYELQDTDSSNVAERGILYREDDSEEKKRVNAREKYEQRVNRAMFQTQEALQDSMLALKEAMNAITKAEGKNVNIEDIDGYENAYLGENRLSSVNKAEADAFAHLLFKPMLAEVSKICKNAQERTELVDYMMAKHGLERNAVMRKRAIEDILNNEKLSDAQKNARAGLAEYRDYAGLTALTGKDNITEAEVDAEVMVSEYENTHDTTNLWDKVNTVNAAILSKSYECGMMNKDTYEKISDMYKYYIPLRGFDETTSEEAYAYLLHQNSAFNAPIKVAKGRSSKADDPFANMQSMAESAITQGNRNKLVKQRFFNFVLNHPSDLVSISDMWLKYDDVADEWKPVFPDNFEENDSAEDIEQKLKEFEDKMKKLAEQAPDKYKHGKETANIPYRVVDSRDLRQHQVLVKRGGRDYVLTLNGNPRAAQALNGQTNPDNDTSGAVGAILKAGEMVNRQLSAFYTTRNPDFVVSNFIRDMLYANSMVWVKESPNYALRFHRNIARCNPAQLKLLLAKHRKGTLDMNNKLEHMFYQFMMNGGETGYANVRDIEQHKNDIRRELKRANGKLSITKAFNLLGEKLDEYNRAVENCARFAAYLTSREMGRIVERSIYDAKEISVNFNKKGSGAKFMNAVGQTKIGTASAFVSGIGRSGFVFWNAAIQGTTNFGRQFKKHPTKAFTASAIMFLLGAVIAGIGMGDGDDDADANSYWNLPEYVRRSNILFKIGDQWVSIPLPVEYRAIYGMGELMVSAMSGKEHFTGSELGKAIAGQATQVLPIDFLEGGGGVKAFVPSAVKPFAEVYSNKGWTGMPIYKDTPYNKYMPEWTKAYKSANKYLVGIAKTLNGATGGDAYTKGSIDINPAQIEYLLNGYFGGVSGTIDKLSKSAETIAGDREYDPRDFLLLNRILKNGDERTEARAINNEYMRVKEEHDVLKARMKHYENDTDKGLFDYADKIDFLYNSPEFARYEIFEDYSKDIDALYKELKEANDGAEHLSIEKELTELKKEMIEEMNKTRK
ncbi:hypothetical protein J5A56_00690 [Prevotella melaninogenica]|uniref:LPD38 domain-containing protein n=1 Tax=Prevotella TaxID=838 RepID=UPI0003ACFACE|nr:MULTISPECIES: LPD38 domain-containing protein [Prevotella]ERJ80079.1 helicase protein [Prevotella sp. F0091]QUB72949.1 hypothetical protein J5A56_00690 [Prevotella melaninogenica]